MDSEFKSCFTRRICFCCFLHEHLHWICHPCPTLRMGMICQFCVLWTVSLLCQHLTIHIALPCWHWFSASNLGIFIFWESAAIMPPYIKVTLLLGALLHQQFLQHVRMCCHVMFHNTTVTLLTHLSSSDLSHSHNTQFIWISTYSLIIVLLFHHVSIPHIRSRITCALLCFIVFIVFLTHMFHIPWL